MNFTTESQTELIIAEVMKEPDPLVREALKVLVIMLLFVIYQLRPSSSEEMATMGARLAGESLGKLCGTPGDVLTARAANLVKDALESDLPVG